MEQLEEQRIQTWRDVLTYRDNFIHISPDASIYDAVKVLIDQRIHRLPMVHPVTGNVLCILTHKRLLKYLYLSDTTRPPFMELSIGQLGIGTHSDIVTVTPTTTVIEALKLFIQHTVSAFPVVDPVSGRCVDIYSKFDVIHLAADRSYDQLDMTIMKALERRKLNQNLPVGDSPTTDATQNTGDINSTPTSNNQSSANSSSTSAKTPATFTYSVVNCKLTDSLNYVVDVIAKAEVHRLVIVDDFQRVIGMISLSDILDYLILKQPAAAIKRSSCHGSSSSVESFEMLPQCQKF